MPILQVKLSAVPTAEAGASLTTKLVDLTTRVLHKKAQLTAVVLDYIAPEHWYVGGASLAEQQKSSFYLDIKVTEGTNTKDEKARYVAEVFALMQEFLGALHSASYVYIDEVQADAFGYGGCTQEYRSIAEK